MVEESKGKNVKDFKDLEYEDLSNSEVQTESLADKPKTSTTPRRSNPFQGQVEDYDVDSEI